jgi:hypothetical protein
MWTTDDGAQTNHRTLWLLAASPDRGLTAEALAQAIETRLGLELFSRSNPSRAEITARLYYWLAGLLAGCLSLKDVPVGAHHAVAVYARTPACVAFAESLIATASHG